MITMAAVRPQDIVGDRDPTHQIVGIAGVEMDAAMVATLLPETVMDAEAEMTTVNAVLPEDAVALPHQISLMWNDGWNMTAAYRLAALKSSAELCSLVALRMFLVLQPDFQTLN